MMTLFTMIMKRPKLLSGSVTPVVLYVLSLSLLAACGAGRSLHFASSLSELRVDSGNTVYLQCILDGNSRPGESFTWSGPAVDSGRASIELDSSSTVSTLTIDSVGGSDEGRYHCSYTGVGTVSIRLNVEFDPHFLNVSEYQEFIEETDAVVECPAFFGDPPGHMIWSRNDRSITDNRFTLENGRMRIQNIQESDEATYRCSINRLGIVDSRYITVAVLERSELAPKIVEPQNPIDVRYGDPLDLMCELEVQRDNVDYTWIVDTGFENSHNKSAIPSLHRDANHFLSGRYTCKAENEYGYDEQVFCVRILAPPEPSTCSEQEETRNEGQTVVLEHCQITSPVQWSDLVYRWSKRSAHGELVEIRPGGQFAVNHDGFLTITDIQPSDSGLYLVNISNSQGSALHTVQLQVIPIVEPPPVRVTLRFESSGSKDSSCQDIKEMDLKGIFTDALEKAICDRLETCSNGTGIELTESRVECSDPDSKVGTYTATASGPSAAKIGDVQLGEFSLDLRDGISLTLNYCGPEDDCSSVKPQVQGSNTAGIASGVVVALVLIILVMVGALLLTLIIRSKCRKPTNKVTDAELGQEGIASPPSQTQQGQTTINLSTVSQNLSAMTELPQPQQGSGGNQTQLSAQDTNLNLNRPVRPNDLCIPGQNNSVLATPKKKKPVYGRSFSLDLHPINQSHAN